MLQRAPRLHRQAELRRGCRRMQPTVDARSWLGVDHDPCLGLQVRLGVAANEVGIGMHLQREVLRGVEELHEEREGAVCGGRGHAE